MWVSVGQRCHFNTQQSPGYPSRWRYPSSSPSSSWFCRVFRIRPSEILNPFLYTIILDTTLIIPQEFVHTYYVYCVLLCVYLLCTYFCVHYLRQFSRKFMFLSAIMVAVVHINFMWFSCIKAQYFLFKHSFRVCVCVMNPIFVDLSESGILHYYPLFLSISNNNFFNYHIIYTLCNHSKQNYKIYK